MENCQVPVHLRDHDYSRERKISACARVRTPRAHGLCPCCRDVQVKKRKRSASAADAPQKKKRTAAVPSSQPSDFGRTAAEAEHEPSASAASQPPVEGSTARSSEPAPQASNAADIPEVLRLVPRPQAAAPAADPPQDSPLTIHSYSVEEYQRIYHEVVDDMLKYKNGKPRPYSLALGRQIKQKLWERLNRPTFTSSVGADGRVHVEVSYGAGASPPSYNVDISEEPKPKMPPSKQSRKCKQ